MSDRANRLAQGLQSKLRLRHLTLLRSIAKLRTLSSVAEAMSLSQPAVSKTLREIEEIFKARLFDRSSRGLTPTPAGRAALRYADIVLADTESTSRALLAIESGVTGRVRIGMTAQAPELLLRAAIDHLLGQEPRVSVLVREGTTDELVAALALRELDCAIGRSFDSHHDPAIRQEVLFAQEPCLMVAAKSLARLSRGPLDWARLAKLDWISPPPNTPMRRTFDAIFLGAGVEPPMPLMETVSLRTIETVFRREPNAVTILPLDLGRELANGGICAPLRHRLSWNLPPVSLFVLRHLADDPLMHSLAGVIRMAAGRRVL